MTLEPGQRNATPNEAYLVFRFGAAELDERVRELRVGGVPVSIESKPFDVLRALLRRPGETLTKEELLDQVWSGRVVTEGVLTKCVMKLRALLGDDEQTVIRTVHGYGYRLGVPVERRDNGAARAFEPRVGDTVPHRPNWRLVRPLGEGGYALVWLAEHTKTHELRVFKYARDGASLTALKREVTIYRVLRESLGADAAILRILDWNVEEPPYHLETEYVGGGNLAEWLAEHPGASLAERLTLLAQCADAIAAAHRVGVLHKDLKPGNVLVQEAEGAAPRALLCDFGIGTVLEPERLAALGITRSGFTRTRGADDDSSGTPRYLAPEVVAGQPPTTRSDVYALGVMLYQLVTGDLQRPLGAGWERDVSNELLREDIAAAADVDPLRRLGDASELAQRLKDLEGRARRRAAEREEAQLRERALRDAEALGRKRRTALVLAVVMTIATGVSVWFYLAARRAQHEAEAQAIVAAEEAASARAINSFLNEDLLAAADPYGQNARDAPIGELVEHAVPRVAERFAAQPRVAGEIYRTLGNVLLNLGRVEPAAAALDLAVAELSKVDDPVHPRLIEARLLRAQVEEFTGDYAENQARLEALHTDVAALDARDPRRLDVERYLAWAEFLLGRFEPARAMFHDAQLRSRGNPAVREVDLATILAGESLALSRLDRAGEALPLAQEALALRSRLLGADHPGTLSTQFSVSTALMALDRAPEAVPILDDLQRQYRELFGATHYQFVLAAHELGVAQLRSDRPAQAIPSLEDAVAAKSAAYGDLAGSTANSISWLGLAQLRAGKPDDAQRTFARLDEFEAMNEGDRRAEIGLRRNIGELALAQGRTDAAEASCARALALAEPLYPATHAQRVTAQACVDLARLAADTDDGASKRLRAVLPTLRAIGSIGTPWARLVERALEPR